MIDSELKEPLDNENLEPEVELPPQVTGWRLGLGWEKLVRLGLGESALRLGGVLALVLLALLVVWVMGQYFLKGEIISPDEVAEAAPQATQIVEVDPPPFEMPYIGAYVDGVMRLAQLHTIIPAKARMEIVPYEVLKGDTIFGIAEKFGLQPETLMWGNYNILADDPHRLKPGQVLNILPVDGAYYEWHAGDGLNGVAKFYGVTPEDIVNFPTNRLNPDTVGDFAAPNIDPGTWLIIPGGRREFITWSAPRITREDPAVARVLGPGSCGTVMDGPVGIGTFIWPTTEKYLSGYDFTPETNHYGIDIAGTEGNPIYAVDNGVVVYAGWNDWGYGNMVVVDHGGDWQSLYAHLSSYSVSCGTGVYQGMVVGALGNTGNSSGPHLHFELRLGSTRVNPWSFLTQ